MGMKEMKQRMKMGWAMQQMTWQMHCPSKLRSSEGPLPARMKKPQPLCIHRQLSQDNTKVGQCQGPG